MPNNDIGRVALAQAGTYRLRVYSDNASTGTYSFRLTGITTDSAFAISVGDTVTNGLAALGAGNLEVPGTYDDYIFDATTNQAVYFDSFIKLLKGEIKPGGKLPVKVSDQYPLGSGLTY